MHPTSKILLPLDTDSAESALEMAKTLSPEVAGLKVGLELVNAAGLGVFERLRADITDNVKIFYDAKFHDIPHTVHGATRAVGRMGLWMFNVHASGGKEMMLAAVTGAGEGADAAGVARPLVIAVTILTSIDQNMLHDQLGVTLKTLPEQVTTLARLAQDAGCDGVVASPQEIALIRQACGPGFLIVTPGVRPAGTDVGDQKRVMTPEEAVRSGADYLVIGRPITAAPDPAGAARAINTAVGNIA